MRFFPGRCAAAAMALLVTAACGAFPGLSSGPLDGVRIMVPNPPGGGYDITARTLAATAADAGLADDIEVFNLPGGAGAAALARLVYAQDDEGLILQMGLGLVAAAHIEEGTVPITDGTPLARLIEEPGALLVPPDSPYATLDDLIDDWTDPDADVLVGGGSSPGGPDYLAAMLLAEEIGEDLGPDDYVWHDGGGELLAALLGHDVDVAAAGAGEYRDAIDAGELRVLAITGPERLDSIDAPTLRESGIDLEFTNWRGLLAPPDVTRAERDELIAALDELWESPQWRSTVRDQYWEDAYLTGDDFGEFLGEEVEALEALLDDRDVS